MKTGIVTGNGPYNRTILFVSTDFMNMVSVRNFVGKI